MEGFVDGGAQTTRIGYVNRKVQQATTTGSGWSFRKGIAVTCTEPMVQTSSSANARVTRSELPA